METCLASLLFAVLTESLIYYQILIYLPFYITHETHALDSTINLFVALTLSSYPFGLIFGHKLRNYLQNKYNPKKSLLINFIGNMIGLIIMSDTTVFDRSIYHFIVGNFIMGLFGNSWNNILSIAHLLESNTIYTKNELYYYLSAFHGIGVIFAGLIGAFFNINNGEKIQFIDTPFIISISLCATTIFLIHYKLNIDDDIIMSSFDDDNEITTANSSSYESLITHPQQQQQQNGGNIFFYYYYNQNSSPSLYESISTFLYGNDKLFLYLWMISLLLLCTIFSFDILFPTYSSISSINGGMGWSSHYIGLFYCFYTFSWIFIILYRFYKLNHGYSVTTSFSNSSLKTLKFNCLTLILIYGIIFPFCINSPTINHSQWSPISWLLLGIILAILLGIISASTSYHIAQSFYDLILNQQQQSNNNNNNNNDAEINNNNNNSSVMNLNINNNKIESIFIILSNTIIYIRIILPIIIQLIFVISIHLNNAMVIKHLHSTREWYQIGNAVFYVLAIMSLTSFILLTIYDNKRREKYGEEIDRQEMSRLIRELRQERQQENNDQESQSQSIQQQDDNNNNQYQINTNEDYHGLGFWLSLNSKHHISYLFGCHFFDYILLILIKLDIMYKIGFDSQMRKYL